MYTYRIYITVYSIYYRHCFPYYIIETCLRDNNFNQNKYVHYIIFDANRWHVHTICTPIGFDEQKLFPLSISEFCQDGFPPRQTHFPQSLDWNSNLIILLLSMPSNLIWYLNLFYFPCSIICRYIYVCFLCIKNNKYATSIKKYAWKMYNVPIYWNIEIHCIFIFLLLFSLFTLWFMNKIPKMTTLHLCLCFVLYIDIVNAI